MVEQKKKTKKKMLHNDDGCYVSGLYDEGKGKRIDC